MKILKLEIYLNLDKNKFEKPLQRITQNLHFPHGGKLSPDGKIIAISNFGLKVKKRRFIQWGEYLDKRKDNITLWIHDFCTCDNCNNKINLVNMLTRKKDKNLVPKILRRSNLNSVLRSGKNKSKLLR